MVAPLAGANVPGGHCWQAALPTELLLKEPGGQGVGEVAPLGQAAPRGQGVAAVEPRGQYVPAGHRAQADDPFAAENRPAPQEWQ